VFVAGHTAFEPLSASGLERAVCSARQSNVARIAWRRLGRRRRRNDSRPIAPMRLAWWARRVAHISSDFGRWRDVRPADRRGRLGDDRGRGDDGARPRSGA